jgi:hypothetical protein
MLNQTAVVLAIGLVAVLMTSASTRVFAQPTLPPNEENKVNNALQSEENKVNNALHADENKIAADEQHFLSVAAADSGVVNAILSGHPPS